MAELIIAVPEALAGDVQRLNIAVDAVCQRALLDSVAARAPRPRTDTLPATPVLTYRARAVVAVARDGVASPTSADLLRGLAVEGDFACEVLRVLGVEIDDVVAAGAASPGDADPLEVSVDRAILCAQALGHSHVGSEHLLLALTNAAPTDSVARALASHGIEPARLSDAVVLMLAGFNFARSSGGLAGNPA